MANETMKHSDGSDSLDWLETEKISALDPEEDIQVGDTVAPFSQSDIYGTVIGEEMTKEGSRKLQIEFDGAKGKKVIVSDLAGNYGKVVEKDLADVSNCTCGECEGFCELGEKDNIKLGSCNRGIREYVRSNVKACGYVIAKKLTEKQKEERGECFDSIKEKLQKDPKERRKFKFRAKGKGVKSEDESIGRICTEQAKEANKDEKESDEKENPKVKGKNKGTVYIDTVNIGEGSEVVLMKQKVKNKLKDKSEKGKEKEEKSEKQEKKAAVEETTVPIDNTEKNQVFMNNVLTQVKDKTGLERLLNNNYSDEQMAGKMRFADKTEEWIERLENKLMFADLFPVNEEDSVAVDFKNKIQQMGIDVDSMTEERKGELNSEYEKLEKARLTEFQEESKEGPDLSGDTVAGYKFEYVEVGITDVPEKVRMWVDDTIGEKIGEIVNGRAGMLNDIVAREKYVVFDKSGITKIVLEVEGNDYDVIRVSEYPGDFKIEGYTPEETKEEPMDLSKYDVPSKPEPDFPALKEKPFVHPEKGRSVFVQEAIKRCLRENARLYKISQHDENVTKDINKYTRVSLISDPDVKGTIMIVNDSKPGDVDFEVLWDKEVHNLKASEVHPSEVKAIGEKATPEQRSAVDKATKTHDKQTEVYEKKFENKIKDKVKGKEDSDGLKEPDVKKTAMERLAELHQENIETTEESKFSQENASKIVDQVIEEVLQQ